MSDRPSRLYLDHNASAPLRVAARDAMLAALALDGNPSSVHAEGRAARRIIEDARRVLADFSHATPERVVFTSGASEAAATLLAPDWFDGDGERRFDRLAVCAADHPALREGGRFAPGAVTRLGVDAAGLLDLAALERWLDAGGASLVALASANGEIGVMQDVEAVARLVRRYDGAFVVDASQAAGRRSLAARSDFADATILSSHKIGGPKGIGAIVLGRAALRPRPLVTGGPQETRRRAGTVAPMLAAGFAAAASEAAAELGSMVRMGAMRDAFETALRSRMAVTILGLGTDRLAQTSAFQIAGRRAETVQIAADLAGIAISAGSACQSGKLGASDALAALRAAGAPVDPALGLVRVSFGSTTRDADLHRLLDVLGATTGQLRDSMHRAA